MVDSILFMIFQIMWIITIIILILHIVLYPFVVVARIMKWKNRALLKTWVSLRTFSGFLGIFKPISAVRFLIPRLKRITTFRRLIFGSKENFFVMLFFFLRLRKLYLTNTQ